MAEYVNQEIHFLPNVGKPNRTWPEPAPAADPGAPLAEALCLAGGGPRGDVLVPLASSSRGAWGRRGES